jgi:signal transduction histidine kinase
MAADNLTSVCAMELRAVLLAATHSQRAQSMQTTLHELRQSTTTMRTMAELLTPRVEPESIEGDIASTMLTQGKHVQLLAREMESALQPAAAPV